MQNKKKFECPLNDSPLYRDFSIRIQPKIHTFQAKLSVV